MGDFVVTLVLACENILDFPIAYCIIVVAVGCLILWIASFLLYATGEWIDAQKTIAKSSEIIAQKLEEIAVSDKSNGNVSETDKTSIDIECEQ